MKLTRTWLGLIFLLVILIFSLLTVFFWDFVRDTIAVPVYNLVWIGDQISKSIPQQVFLGVLVLLCSLVGLATLMSLAGQGRVAEADQRHTPLDTRYAYWRRHCTNFQRSGFSREQIAIEGRKLVLAVLAYAESKSVSEVEALVLEGSLVVPTGVRDLIDKKGVLDSQAGPPARLTVQEWLHRLLHPSDLPTDAPVDSQITEIISFIEHYLEITNVGNQA